MYPQSRELLHNRYSGLDNCILQVLSKDAGTPSAPAAEPTFRSEQACCMSSSVKFISDRVGPFTLPLKKCLASLTLHSSLGETKTELYCFPSSDAANSGSGFGLPLDGSMKGPILALVFYLDLAKEKNDFGLALMLKTA